MWKSRKITFPQDLNTSMAGQSAHRRWKLWTPSFSDPSQSQKMLKKETSTLEKHPIWIKKREDFPLRTEKMACNQWDTYQFHHRIADSTLECVRGSRSQNKRVVQVTTAQTPLSFLCTSRLNSGYSGYSPNGLWYCPMYTQYISWIVQLLIIIIIQGFATIFKSVMLAVSTNCHFASSYARCKGGETII